MTAAQTMPISALPALPAAAGARDAVAWFCVRTQPKHEHIAAAHLEREAGIEVCLPRVRYRRPKGEIAAWVTEAMFPGYLFARFCLATAARQVHHARGVAGIVHFGEHWPSIPDALISDLRAEIGAGQVCVLDGEVRPGDEVLVCGGPLRNLRAVVTRVMPARQRVAVLLEFLGRQTLAELGERAVVKERLRAGQVVEGWPNVPRRCIE